MMGWVSALRLAAVCALFILALSGAQARAEGADTGTAEEAYCLRLQTLYAGALDAAYRLSDAAFAVEEAVFGITPPETAREHVTKTITDARRQILILEREMAGLSPTVSTASNAETREFLEDFTSTLRRFPEVLRGQISTLQRRAAAGLGGDYIEYDRLSKAGFQDETFLLSVQNALLSSFQIATGPTMPETMLTGAMFESNKAQILYGRALATFQAERSLTVFSEGMAAARSALARSESALDSTLASSERLREDLSASSAAQARSLAQRVATSYRDAVAVERRLNRSLGMAVDLVEQGAHAPAYFESPGLWFRLEAIEADVADVERRRGALYDQRTQLFQEVQGVDLGG